MTMAEEQPVLIAGQWRQADAVGTFKPDNPTTREPTGEVYPVSSLREVEEAVEAAFRAAEQIAQTGCEITAQFLERFAGRLEERAEEICAMANKETALPVSPRLKDVELPRTSSQLRQAGAAARDRSWTLPTIDTKTNIRSMYGPLGGGVAVFGPNNFPLAFNGAAGGDFAAAIAAGNPVIAKANSSHPGTTRLLAEEAHAAAQEVGMPVSMVQLIYRTDHQVGKRLVSHPKIAATGYTGSRAAGLVLKEAADRAGKPIYLELSSINPVVVLPGALKERGAAIADEFLSSCLLGTGQFCTNPGIVLLLRGAQTDRFVELVKGKFGEAPVGTLLGAGVEKGMEQSVEALKKAGAEVIQGGRKGGGKGYSFQNTLLWVSGRQFLEHPETLQTEVFGNESLLVIADDADQAVEVAQHFEGNLTGCMYSDAEGDDEPLYRRLAPVLRRRVGRLLNDKMPTGVAVVPSMNHGGPYPATGHPGFTAVGIPASLRRFAMLECYDNVRQNRLPAELRNQNPTGKLWRLVDGEWTQADVPA
jgi:NADP-dependent aldehyde dehydrogenase